jgi:hypothetical protein
MSILILSCRVAHNIIHRILTDESLSTISLWDFPEHIHARISGFWPSLPLLMYARLCSDAKHVLVSNDDDVDANALLGDAKKWMRRKRRLDGEVIISIG